MSAVRPMFSTLDKARSARQRKQNKGELWAVWRRPDGLYVILPFSDQAPGEGWVFCPDVRK